MTARIKPVIQHTFPSLIAVVLAGVFANWLLWPDQPLPNVARFELSDYFSPAYLAKAESFRGVQSVFSLLAMSMLVVVPLLLTIMLPKRLAGFGERSSVRRLGATALVAAGTTLLTLLAALPFRIAALIRARDVELVVQPIGDWLLDWLQAALLTAFGVALVATAAVGLMRLTRRFWSPLVAGLLIGVAIFVQVLAPVLLAPLFGDFERLPAGATRTDIELLSQRANVDAGEIYVIDAATRTNAANAYVTGLGATKRVVLYDTLLKDFNHAEVRNVVAHELGHAHYGDIRRGLIWFAIVASISTLAIARVAGWLARRQSLRLDSAAGAVSLIALAMVAAAISQPAANAYSRQIEARADAFAIEQTADANAAIALERRLTTTSISRPDPPAVLHWFFGTHPTSVERIGAALTMRR